MCNDCVEIVCIDLYVNPCDTGINLGIEAPEDDDYTIYIEFNGVIKTTTVTVEGGKNITIPNVLIAPYIHEIRIYDSGNVLLNDTCYMANVILTLGTANNITPDPQPGARKIIVVDVNGESFTNSFFGLHTIIEIVTTTQAYIAGVDFEQDGSTITWINGNRFYDGQTILAQA